MRAVARVAGRLAQPLVAGALAATAVAQPLPERPPRASVSDTPVPGAARVPLNPDQYSGRPITRLFLDLYGGTGSAAADDAARQGIQRAAQQMVGGAFSRPLADRALAQIGALPHVRDASYRLFAGAAPGAVVLVVSATLVADAAPPPGRGALQSGEPGDLPVLFQDGRALLRLQLKGGLGAFNDHNPWFASPQTYAATSPIAIDPPGAGNASWAEGYVEYGLGGAAQFGDAPLYAFGEITGLTSAATGQDLFRSDTRTRTLVEQGYAGLLWDEPQAQRFARVSVGRQNWQLNDGYLFSRYAGSANAGPIPGLYLNPRTTYQQAAIAAVGFGNLRAEYFDLVPTELKGLESNTRYQGLHLWWKDDRTWDLGLAAYRVPESLTVFKAPQGDIPREGQQTWNLRAGHHALAGIENLSVLGEFARQTNTDANVRATAWYAQATYLQPDWPWKPSLTYRYASFSGNDPASASYGAFDAPLSSGLDDWVQGVNFRKVVVNSNLNTDRVRLNLAPSERLNLTFDFYRLMADVPLPTGQRNYGNELDLIVRWSISPSLFALGVAGMAWPGDVIDTQTQGTARPWSTVQASLFWSW
jgi:hypothetical protein